MHSAPQIWPVRLRDQMKMVAHQNETQNRRLKAFRRFTEQLDKVRAISLAVKNCLAPITTGTEMVNRILEFDAQRSRPLSRVAIAPTNAKCLDLTPFFLLLAIDLPVAKERRLLALSAGAIAQSRDISES
jgi:hypothetical protein